MLARLDELTATLGTVRGRACAAATPRAHPARPQVGGDAAQQQAVLAPAFSSITAGLARDFAYIDGVGVRRAWPLPPRSRAHGSVSRCQDALVNVRAAVQKMEAELALAEAALFKCGLRVPSLRAPTDARAQATTSGCVFQLLLSGKARCCNRAVSHTTRAGSRVHLTFHSAAARP